MPTVQPSQGALWKALYVQDVANGFHSFSGMNVEFLYYTSPDKELMDQQKYDDKMAAAFFDTKMSLMDITKTINIPRFTYDCKMALFDEDFVKRLQRENYDIALADVMIPCYHLLAYKLGIPAVTVSTTLVTWFLKTHPLVSYFEPCLVNKETNTFIVRLKTLFHNVMFERVILPSIFIDTKPFMNYVPEKPYSSLEEVIMKTSKLYIFNRNGLIDCPTPTMPNLVVAAGLTTKPPKALQADYQKYVSESNDGIIIVSFGSGIAFLPKDIFLKFLNAFRSIKQNVIWRTTKTYGETIPKNVKIVQWMPQNDLMAQPSVKLFITHCGNNGQIEALYHGVPMLGFPVFADQHYNVERIAHKGYGFGMNIHDFTTEDFVKNINEIITNPKYSEAIRKASAIHRSLPDPRNTSAFWVDHVMKYGSDHLTTTLSEMSIVQFFMLDIFLFLFVALIIILYLVKKIIKKVICMLTKKGDDTKKTN
jgi:glucuronosyltransferase